MHASTWSAEHTWAWDFTLKYTYRFYESGFLALCTLSVSHSFHERGLQNRNQIDSVTVICLLLAFHLTKILCVEIYFEHLARFRRSKRHPLIFCPSVHLNNNLECFPNNPSFSYFPARLIFPSLQVLKLRHRQINATGCRYCQGTQNNPFLDVGYFLGWKLKFPEPDIWRKGSWIYRGAQQVFLMPHSQCHCRWDTWRTEDCSLPFLHLSPI